MYALIPKQVKKILQKITVKDSLIFWDEIVSLVEQILPGDSYDSALRLAGENLPIKKFDQIWTNVHCEEA